MAGYVSKRLIPFSITVDYMNRVMGTIGIKIHHLLANFTLIAHNEWNRPADSERGVDTTF